MSEAAWHEPSEDGYEAPSALASPLARLEDAHKLWHQAEALYFEPDGFRISLNSCIQTLRSVTFLLQKNKAQIPDFGTWYPRWQEKMREDPILRWLVDARNQIVKEGDLELKSILLVGVLASYFDPPYSQSTKPPSSTTTDVLEELQLAEIPEEIRKNGYLRLERRWVAETLEDYEQLDALAYCYSRLSLLLHDAWKLLATNVPDLSLESGILPCMIRSDDDRSIWINLTSGLVEPLQVIAHTPEVSRDELEARYGPLDTEPLPLDDSELKRLAHLLFNRGRVMLQTDGTHGFFVFVITPDKNMQLLQLLPEQQGDKYRMWREVATVVERSGSTSVIAISEVWLAPEDQEQPYMHAAESPERSEALQLAATSKDGEEFLITAPFHRQDDQIILDDMIDIEAREINFFQPIKDVWMKLDQSE